MDLNREFSKEERKMAVKGLPTRLLEFQRPGPGLWVGGLVRERTQRKEGSSKIPSWSGACPLVSETLQQCLEALF